MNLIDDDDFTPDSPDPNKPRVVFPGAYRLTREQEDKLMDHAKQRLEDLEKELGRDLAGGLDWWASSSTDQVGAGSKSFLGRRQIYELTYDNEMDWRAQVKGGIFAESNWTVPITRRVVAHQVARANAHFFGTEPWFAADVEGVESKDADLQQRAERWTRHKFRKAGIKAAGESAVERAFIRGEAVLKRTHRQQADIFEAEMTVMVDSRTNNPVLDSRGEYITPERAQTMKVIRVAVEAGPVARAFGNPTKTVDKMILPDDPAVEIPLSGQHRWEKRIVSRRNVLYSGPHAELCYFKDILIPLTAKDVESADCIAHLYNIPLSELADQWKRQGEGLGEEARNIETRNAVEAIREMRGNSPDLDSSHATDNRGAASLYRTERPEDATAHHGMVGANPESATAKVVEQWLRVDANKDGIIENILLVWDRETGIPIHYNYVGNITPDGKRPFSVLRINPIEGRWYGLGSMQVYEGIQNICDLQVNRWNFANGSSGRITFVNRNAIKGAETDAEMEIHWGETYDLVEGFTAEQAVAYVVLPNVDIQDIKLMLDFYLHFAHSMSGVQQPNDVGVNASQASKTATSIIQTTNSGQEMFGQLLSHLEAGISPFIDDVAELAVVNMADAEPYAWEEEDHLAFGVFSRKLMGEGRLRLRLILSKYKAEQQKVALASAIDKAVQYYTLPPEIQEAVADMYRQFLRAHDIQGVDQIIQLPQQQAVPAGPVGGPEAFPEPTAAPPAQTDGNTFAPQMEGGMAGGLAAAG